MTVAELIAKLQQMPLDAVVIYSFRSDWSVLVADQVESVTAEQSRSVVDEEAKSGTECWGRKKRAICFRGGEYRDAYPFCQYPSGEQPVYHDVVTFPGN